MARDAYNHLDDTDEDVEAIDYRTVSSLAREGLKNPRLIAHAMDLPMHWFTDVYKEKVDLAIERGLSELVFETTGQIRQNARDGDFQAQKYILQNIDETWTDKKEIINRNEIDIKGLPPLHQLFAIGNEPTKEKDEKVIEGEYDEKC